MKRPIRAATQQASTADKVLRIGYDVLLKASLQDGAAGEITLDSKNKVALRKRSADEQRIEYSGKDTNFMYFNLGKDSMPNGIAMYRPLATVSARVL